MRCSRSEYPKGVVVKFPSFRGLFCCYAPSSVSLHFSASCCAVWSVKRGSARLPLRGEHRPFGAQPLAAGTSGDYEPKLQRAGRRARRAPPPGRPLVTRHVLPVHWRWSGSALGGTKSRRLRDLDRDYVGLAAVIEEAEGEVPPVPAARLIHPHRQVFALVRARYPPEVDVDGRVHQAPELTIVTRSGQGCERVLRELELAAACPVRARRRFRHVGDDDLDAALCARAPVPAPQLVAGAAGLAAAEKSSTDGRNVESPVGKVSRRRQATVPARGAGEGGVGGVGRQEGGGGPPRAPVAAIRWTSRIAGRRGHQDEEKEKVGKCNGGGHGRRPG